jgi:hypothetical protein
MDSTARGTLICWEEPGVPRMMQVRFLPDQEGETPQDFWMQEAKEPVIGEDMNYSGTVFRAYGKMEVSSDAEQRLVRVAVKMPVRTQ